VFDLRQGSLIESGSLCRTEEDKEMIGLIVATVLFAAILYLCHRLDGGKDYDDD
jgi:hypothetical protein